MLDSQQRYAEDLTFKTAILLLAFAGGAFSMVFLDQRVLISGDSRWLKPTKFFLSFSIHLFAMYYFGRLTDRLAEKRSIWSMILISQVAVILVELLCIVIQAIRGIESHFNYSTNFDRMLFGLMGIGTGIILITQLLLLYDLYRRPTPNPISNTFAASGIVISILGSGIGLHMVLPTPEQKYALSMGQKLSVIGSHLYGAASGERIPFVGWDLLAGDWRFPHFIGLHGFQYCLIGLYVFRFAKFDSLRLCLVAIFIYVLIFLGSISFTLGSGAS